MRNSGDLNRSIKIYIDNSAAVNSAEELEKKIGALESKLISLQTAGKGNSEQSKKIEKEISALSKKYETYKEQVAATEKVLRNLSGATYDELIRAKREVEKQLRSTTRNTDLYNKRLEVQKAVSRQLILVQKDMRTEIGCQASSWGRAADFVNKYMGLLGSAVAALTGITMAFARFRDERDKLQASSANLKALTGLGDEEVSQLEKAAKRLSTTITKEGVRIRQSAVEIDDSFAVIGSQRPELLKNAEALEKVTQDAIYLSIAGKDKLEPAAKALTTVMNQMNLGASESRRIINAIAAGSQAGAANIQYITDAFEKSGTTANLLNIELEQHIGLIEAVAPKYAEASIAGNSLDKVLLKMKEKGIGYKDGVFDLSRAISDLETKFKTGESAASIFGVEHAKMAEILVMNKADIDRYTEAVTGTNKAVEQAQINSDTNEAKRAQARNKMNLLAMDLMEKLNPAITSTMNQTVHWTGKLVSLATWISKNSGLITSLVITIGTYTAVIKLNSYWNTVKTSATLKATIAEKSHLAAIRISITAEYALAAAKMLLTGNIKAATVAMKGFLTTLGLNPFVAIGVALSALVVGIYKVWDNSTKTARAIKDMNKEIAQEKSEALTLFDALQKSNTGTQRRKDLIDEINSKYGKYLENQLTEKSTTEDIASALKIVNEKLEENIVLKKMQKEKEDITTKSFEKQKEKMDSMREHSNLGEFVTDAMLRDVKRITEEGLKYGRTWTQSYNDVVSYIDHYYSARGKVDNDFWSGLQGYISETYQMAIKMDKVSKTYSPFLPKKESNKNEGTVLDEVVITPDNNKPTVVAQTATEKEKEIINTRLKEIDRYIQTKKLKITQDYADGIILFDDYNNKIQALELEKLNKQLEIYNIGSDERKKIEQLILDNKIKLLGEGFQEYLKNIQKEGELDREKEKQKKEHLDRLKKLLNEHAEEQLSEEQERFEKRKEREEEKLHLLSDISSQAGQILGEALTNAETTFAEAMNNILLLTLDTLRQIAIMAITERTIKNVGHLGFLGLAKAAGEIALINIAFGALKGLIKKPSTRTANSGLNSDGQSQGKGAYVVKDTSGWYDGGHTGHGDIKGIAGFVHREEFVVPAWEMQLPEAMNHVIALEAIRRQRTDANPLPAGYASGGYTGSTSPDIINKFNSKDLEIIKVLHQLITILSSLQAKGVRAYVVYSDIQEAEELLDKSKNIGGKQ